MTKYKRGDKVKLVKSLLELPVGLTGRVVDIMGTDITVAFRGDPFLRVIDQQDQHYCLELIQ